MKFNFSKSWCARAADVERGFTVAAGKPVEFMVEPEEQPIPTMMQAGDEPHERCSMSDPNKHWNRGVRIPPDLWQHVLRTAKRGRGNIPETSGYIRDLIRRDMEERGAYVVETPR